MRAATWGGVYAAVLTKNILGTADPVHRLAKTSGEDARALAAGRWEVAVPARVHGQPRAELWDIGGHTDRRRPWLVEQGGAAQSSTVCTCRAGRRAERRVTLERAGYHTRQAGGAAWFTGSPTGRPGVGGGGGIGGSAWRYAGATRSAAACSQKKAHPDRDANRAITSHGSTSTILAYYYISRRAGQTARSR